MIYDLACESETAILRLLYKNPHLLVIGLDIETNRAMLIARRETSSLTLDLVKETVDIAATNFT